MTQCDASQDIRQTGTRDIPGLHSDQTPVSWKEVNSMRERAIKRCYRRDGAGKALVGIRTALNFLALLGHVSRITISRNAAPLALLLGSNVRDAVASIIATPSDVVP